MSEFWSKLGSGALKSAGNALSGGLSSAVSGLVNGAIGAIFRPSLRQQINSQKELMQEQNRINRENYDYQFDKTSPANMVQLYRDAGLNPGLMYSGNAGSGVRASMGSSSIGSLSPYNGGVMTDPSMIANIENIKADTSLKKSSSNLTDEKVASEKLEQVNKDLESVQRRKNLAKTDDERKKLQAEEDEILARAELIRAQTQTENDLRDSRKRQIDNEADLSRAKTETEDRMRDLNAEYKEVQTQSAKVDKALKEFRLWYQNTYHADIPSGLGNVAQTLLNAVIGEKGGALSNPDPDKPGAGFAYFWKLADKLGIPRTLAVIVQEWLRE